jgi:hypothetical protein
MEFKNVEESKSYVTERFNKNGKRSRKPIDKGQIVDLNTTLLPFFTATNAMGLTKIPTEALNTPQYLVKNLDGTVKFSKSGEPVLKVNEEIIKNLKMIKDNLNNGDANFEINLSTKESQTQNSSENFNVFFQFGAAKITALMNWNQNGENGLCFPVVMKRVSNNNQTIAV